MRPIAGADQDVELLRTGEHQARIDPNPKRHEASEDEQHCRIHPRPKPAVKGHVERPSNDAGNDCGKKDIDEGIIYVVSTAEYVLRSQVEDAVGAQSSGRAVVQVKEPNRAVDQGEAHGEQCVHGAHGQAVERELQGLGRGLDNLPAEVCDDGGGQNRCQRSALVLAISQQCGERGFPELRQAHRANGLELCLASVPRAENWPLTGSAVATVGWPNVAGPPSRIHRRCGRAHPVGAAPRTL